MPNRVENMIWGELVETYKLKDNGLLKAIKEYSVLKTKEEYDGALAKLTSIQKLEMDLKNSKEAKAAGPDVIKRMSKLIEAGAKSRKELESRKAEAAKAGCRADVQIILEAWNGKSMYGCVAKVVLSPVGGNAIQKALSIAGTALNIKDVYLKPTGSVDLSIYHGSDLSIEGTGTWKDLIAGKSALQFRFTQDSTTAKIKAKTLEEASKKLKTKLSAGIEIKVLTIDGEVAKESEYKEGFEQEVEWELEGGKLKFKEIKATVA
jgi:hypothetical protein